MKELVLKRFGSFRSRTVSTTVLSLLLGTALGAGKLALGIATASSWLWVNGIYCLMLCMARGHLLARYRQVERFVEAEQRCRAELLAYRRSGLFICLLGFSYLAVCLHMARTGDGAAYHEYVAYGVAFMAFTKVGLAISGLVTTRRMGSPLFAAFKIVNVLDGGVSLVVTQCALLMVTGSPDAVGSSARFGMGVSALFLLMGLRMLTKQKQ